MLQGRYILQKKLFASHVSIAFDIVTKQRVVMKHIKYTQGFTDEVDNHKQLEPIIPQHPQAHFSKMIDYFSEENTIILPYVRGQDMLNTVTNIRTQGKHFSESYVRSWMTKAHSCIKALHDNNQVHLDVKLENFITTPRFDEDEVTLIDFQCMEKVFSKHYKSLSYECGTRTYLSPEISLHKKFVSQSDLWCLGLCGFIIAAQFHPLQRCGVNYKNVQSYAYDNLDGYSQEYRDNIASMLSFNPYERKWKNY